MKTSFFVALFVLASATLFFSCDWLKGKPKQENASFVLEGNWQLDSLAYQKDTTKSIGLLALGLLQKDSILQYSFTKDSVFVNRYPSGTYQFNAISNSLVITADSIATEYTFEAKADSAFSMADKNGTVFFFKKQ